MTARRAPRPQIPWWHFAIYVEYTGTWEAWFNPVWWHQAWWNTVGPLFRLAVRSGVWRVQHGDLYVNGRLQWPDMWSRPLRDGAP